MQPLEKVDGAIRFRPNRIVKHMLDICRALGTDLNEILKYDYPQRDVEQFYQLIGYSVGKYEELSFISDKSVAEAKRQVTKFKVGKRP